MMKKVSIQVFTETTNITKLTQVLWFITWFHRTDVHDDINYINLSTLLKPLGPELFG